MDSTGNSIGTSTNVGRPLKLSRTERINATNRALGETLNRLRSTHTIPSDIRGTDGREEWLMSNLSTLEYSEYVETRNALIETNIDFVRLRAHKMFAAHNRQGDVDDLISGGVIALLGRMWDFDPDKGTFTTFADAILTKGMREANDADSPFEKRTTRENVVEARRLAILMPTSSFEERAQASGLRHFRDSPKSLEQWTAVAHGWVGRIELDREFINGEGEVETYQVASPTPRGLDENDSLMRALSSFIPDPCDVTLIILYLGLDGQATVGVKDLSAVARMVDPDFPVLSIKQAGARIEATLFLLRDGSDDIREMLLG